MSQHRNLDIAGKTPALGLGAPTNYLKKKFSLVWPAQILVTKAKVCANLFVLQSLWISFDYVSHGAHKSTDDGWHTPGDAPLAPPGLPSTPQSSWQPYSNANMPQGSWVSLKHVFKQPDARAADKPVVIEPLDEPAPSRPMILEVVHPVQLSSTAVYEAEGDLMREPQQHSAERMEEAWDPDPDVKDWQDFWIRVSNYEYRIMLLRERNCMFRRTIPDTSALHWCPETKPTPALTDFTKQSPMIIGILMERSHCLNPGSVSQVLNCSPKSHEKYTCWLS